MKLFNCNLDALYCSTILNVAVLSDWKSIEACKVSCSPDLPTENRKTDNRNRSLDNSSLNKDD